MDHHKTLANGLFTGVAGGFTWLASLSYDKLMGSVGATLGVVVTLLSAIKWCCDMAARRRKRKAAEQALRYHCGDCEHLKRVLEDSGT